VKRMSDTLTYRGIASEAVFTEPPVVGEFTLSYYPYLRLWKAFYHGPQVSSAPGKSVLP